ncbi:tRNA (guanosine(37)-N1)-methyltransferase TrmD [Candidatus Margulisiibacteriota bacterium]
MKIFILTLFAEEMGRYFLKGLLKKAHEKKLFDIQFIDIRNSAKDKHRKVDDYPYGHRKGMILKADVLYDAITSIKDYQKYQFIYLCPKGKIFNQEKIRELSQKQGLIVLAGYFEGVDERIFSFFNIERLSLGNFILSNGELPALVVADAVLRYIPGVIGNPECIEEESLASGLIEAPQYTAPRKVRAAEVPEVVLSGNHQAINSWRRKESIRETLFSKPSLFMNYDLSNNDCKEIENILKEE